MLLSYLVLRLVVQCQTIDYSSAEFTRNVTIEWGWHGYWMNNCRKEGRKHYRRNIKLIMIISKRNGILRVWNLNNSQPWNWYHYDLFNNTISVFVCLAKSAVRSHGKQFLCTIVAIYWVVVKNKWFIFMADLTRKAINVRTPAPRVLYSRTCLKY